MFASLRYFDRFLLILFVLSVAGSAAAQTVGDCAPGTAEGVLSVNDVRATLFNGGNLFFGNATTNGDGYLVPKASGNSPIYSASVWVGGQVEGELRVAGALYRDFEFWPGPLGENGTAPTAEECTASDRIYTVSRSDIARYYETGEATDDLRDWPAHLGAPVLDGDGVVGDYNLAGGDQPAIWGEQTAWWVMNDAGNVHSYSGTPPVGLEARVTAFAMPWPVAALHQATFYRYHFTYRGTETLDSVYVTVYVDSDLGDASDDLAGADTTLEMGFVYNAAEEDTNYGVPPAAGLVVLDGPVGLPNGRDDDGDGVADESGERLGMTAAPCYAKTLEAEGGGEMYNCMRGLWPDGIPITEYGDGYRTDGEVTTFSFPGDPVAGEFWSEENPRDEGRVSTFGADRRFVVATGPFRLEPGEAAEYAFAFAFGQGADRLDSIVKLRKAARYVENAYRLGRLDPVRVPGFSLPEPPSTYGLSRPFPNPFRDATALTLRVPDDAAPIRLAVYDVLGREVAVLADGTLPPGEHPLTIDGRGLAAGSYVVRLQVGLQTESLRIVHID